MSWPTLSEDVWKHILVHVPLKQRLGSCNRVNQTLYRAAAAATQQIELYLREAGVQRLLGVCQWMMNHGQHLTSLQLNVPGGTLTQLPCPNLRELDLGNMQVQLSASSTQPWVLHRCTRLTKLCLMSCQFDNGHSSPAALSSLVRLQNLTIVTVDSKSTSDTFMPSSVLQHLTQLTRLFLMYPYVPVLLSMESLQHTSCLVNLQELHITGSSFPLSPSTTPGLSRLTALRKVHLEHVDLEPSILQDCTQLQGLELHHLAIISAGGAAALHCLLGRLQQLQSLQLIELEYDWPVAAAAYTSLTASSNLTTLALTVDNLPPGIWPHVFPSDRQLPALQEFRWYDEDVPQPPPPAAPGTDDISRLARCCPGLHTISVTVQPDAQLSALVKVSGLTSLWVTKLPAEGFESLRTLSGLVSLRHLSIYPEWPITPQDLLCLTALTGLTALSIQLGAFGEAEGAADVAVYLTQVCTVSAD